MIAGRDRSLGRPESTPIDTLARRLLVGSLLIASLAAPAQAALLNVRDFPSPAAALAAAHDGDRVYFPAPGPYPAPPGGWTIAKSLELFGDGPGRDMGGSSSIVPDQDGNAFVLDSTAALVNLHLHDLRVVASNAKSGARAALRVTMPDAGTNTFSGLRLERVTFAGLGGDAVRLDGGARNAILLVSLTDCEANTCGGNGVTLRHTTTTTILNGYYHGCGGFGLYAEGSGVRLFGAAFEHNQLTGRSNDFESQVRLKLCHGFTVIGCHFEEFADAARPARTAITVENCLGGQVTSCGFFKNGAGVAGSRGVLILGGSRGVDVGTNSWARVDTLVAVRGWAANPGCVVRPQAAMTTDAQAAGVVLAERAGGTISVDAGGPATAGRLDRIARSGELATTVLVPPGAGGVYRVSAVVATDAPGGGRLSVRLEWNDGAARTRDVIDGFDLAEPDAMADGSCTVFVAAGQRLTCRTLGAGNEARFSLHVRAEAL